MTVLGAIRAERSILLPAVKRRETIGMRMPTRWSAAPSSRGCGRLAGSGKSVGCGIDMSMARPPKGGTPNWRGVECLRRGQWHLRFVHQVSDEVARLVGRQGFEQALGHQGEG